MKVPPPSRSSSIPVAPANDHGALARAAESAPEWCKDAEWQRLWLSTLVEPQDNWRSLALVPAGAALSAERMLEIAQGLAYAGMTHLHAQVHIANGLTVDLQQVMQIGRDIETHARPPHRVLIPLASIDTSFTTPTLAKMADACLLCVVHGETRRSDIQRTLDSIGAARFVGAAVFHNSPARRA